MHDSLYSCWLRFTKQEQTLYPGKPNNGNFSVRELKNQNAFIKINNLGVILLEKEFYTQ